MKKYYVRTKENHVRIIYPEHVEPRLRTAYKYFERAYNRYQREVDDGLRACLRQQADTEMSNVYRVAFGK